MTDTEPIIMIAAGTNGAGKSSVVGEAFRLEGSAYYNPDEQARMLRLANPSLSQRDANITAWREEMRLLDAAIAERRPFTFETTLGGKTVTQKLIDAAGAGFKLRMWYVALESVEIHIERVRQRVLRGGHDIPEADIRKRYVDSPNNLIRLLPYLADLRMYDNTRQLSEDDMIEPRELLHIRNFKIVFAETQDVPHWATAIISAAMKGTLRS